jgi:muramoyltetrapeptide carboxypeptidase
MRRRGFITASLLSVAGSGFGRGLLPPLISRTPKLTKPRSLAPGSRVALIAPASPAPPERIQAGMDNLKMLGFEVVPGAALFARHGHLAGKDEERLSDLHWAFSDPSIDGVWCVRGGYGCTRLLDRIDFSLIKRHPKVFVGYSDITALHLSIFQKTGMHTFHGPVAASDYPEFTVSHLRAAISGGDFTQQVIESGAGSSVKDAAFQPAVIAPVFIGGAGRYCLPP